MVDPSSPHNQCRHPEDPVGGWVCRHLLDDAIVDGSESGGRLYVGRGLQFRVICEACKDAPPAETFPVCEYCLSGVDNGGWMTGEAEVRERRSGLRFAHAAVPDLLIPKASVLDVEPVGPSGSATWFVLLKDGSLHGGLLVSPDQNWIADNGWIWHPVGVVTTWSLERWITETVWESEDGPTRRTLCWRDYFWDGPVCWIDNTTLAVYGHGRDEDTLVPAAVLYDVISGREIGGFAGPKGTFAFDEYLFDFSANTGTAVWDVETGERLLWDHDLHPLGYHHGSRSFLSITDHDEVVVSELVVDPSILSETC